MRVFRTSHVAFLLLLQPKHENLVGTELDIQSEIITAE